MPKKSSRTSRPSNPVSRVILALEELEHRELLSVTPSITGTTTKNVTFNGSGEVFLRTIGNDLQWSQDGISFSADFDNTAVGTQGVDFTTVTGLTVDALTAEGITKLTLGNLQAPGDHLTFKGSEIVVNSATIDTTVVGGTNGNIRFEVTKQAALSADTTSKITLTNSTIRGGVVSLVTSAIEDTGIVRDGRRQSSNIDLKDSDGGNFRFPLFASVVQPKATSIISMSGGLIDADSVLMDADAEVGANANTNSIYVGAIYGRFRPRAEVTLQNGPGSNLPET